MAAEGKTRDWEAAKARNRCAQMWSRLPGAGSLSHFPATRGPVPSSGPWALRGSGEGRLYSGVCAKSRDLWHSKATENKADPESGQEPCAWVFPWRLPKNSCREGSPLRCPALAGRVPESCPLGLEAGAWRVGGGVAFMQSELLRSPGAGKCSSHQGLTSSWPLPGFQNLLPEGRGVGASEGGIRLGEQNAQRLRPGSPVLIRTLSQPPTS